MLIKSAENRDHDIEALEKIAAREGASDALKAQIQNEIKMILVGSKGEREAAYEIDFYLRDSRDYAVIHDLRLDFGGRVAQIDHLVIDRNFVFWVLESKHFAEGVAVSSEGEFTAFYYGRPKGIPSPTEQNRRHCDVLRDVITKGGTIELPKFLFMDVKPKFRNIVLVSKQARIQRAEGWNEAYTWIIKADQFRSFLKKQEEKNSPIGWAFSSQWLKGIASELAAYHQPIRFDWEARFAASSQPEQPAAPAESPQPMEHGAKPCDECGTDLTPKEVRFCRFNKARFHGGVYCKTCQPKVGRRQTSNPAKPQGSPSSGEAEEPEPVRAAPEKNRLDARWFGLIRLVAIFVVVLLLYNVYQTVLNAFANMQEAFSLPGHLRGK